MSIKNATFVGKYRNPESNYLTKVYAGTDSETGERAYYVETRQGNKRIDLRAWEYPSRPKPKRSRDRKPPQPKLRKPRFIGNFHNQETGKSQKVYSGFNRETRRTVYFIETQGPQERFNSREFHRRFGEKPPKPEKF